MVRQATGLRTLISSSSLGFYWENALLMTGVESAQVETILTFYLHNMNIS